MSKKSMTALVCAYVRHYHLKKQDGRVFRDELSEKLLTQEEFNDISREMRKGISFFNPNFEGSDEEALEWIVSNQLSPSILSRSKFIEEVVKNEVALGASQYLILASGYDTFGVRNPYSQLKVFEVDLPHVIEDKLRRLEMADILPKDNHKMIAMDMNADGLTDNLYDQGFSYTKTLVSLMGISYYLSLEAFDGLISKLSAVLAEGSAIAFDYPNEVLFDEDAPESTKKQVLLAAGAGEPMKASYSLDQLTACLENHGFLIYELLEPDDINQRYLHDHTAFEHVNLCLAVKPFIC